MRPPAAILAAVLLTLALVPATAQDRPDGFTEVPRKVLALYDGREERPRESAVHAVAQMPLEHLGLTVELHDVRSGLPDVDALAGYRGVLTWFYDRCTDDPEGYLDWAGRAVDAGLRFVIVGHPCAEVGPAGQGVSLDRLNRFLGRVGLERRDGGSGEPAYAIEVLETDPAMVGYERSLPPVLPPYDVVRPFGEGMTSHLVVGMPGDPASRSHAVLTGPRGGYIAPGYLLSETYDSPPMGRQLHVDLFAFFAEAFGTREMPAPDTTTLSGRRLYFSHIDGDGWNNVTLVPGYTERQALAAEVVLEEIIRAHPGLPVTVAPIAGDLDPAWYGIGQSIPVARRIFAEPQVEAGSHTYSHVFQWSFFEDYDPARERPFLPGYPRRPDNSAGTHGWPDPPAPADAGSEPALVIALDAEGEAPVAGPYARPRAYAVRPFDLDHEIAGSIAFIERLLPPGKRVRVLQWPGDNQPFPAAMAAARRAGVLNLNGGDTRMDSEYPSYSWVAPLGFGEAGEHQTYSANANEYFYVLGGDRSRIGYWKLPRTLDNTETPRRLRPINLYYHMFSGERLAELNAIKANLSYIAEQEITPVAASRYAATVDGFRRARLYADGDGRWRISDRGTLQTLRFDRAAFAAVDFERSVGVIGQRHHQGSLYVALDEAVAEPVVALRTVERTDRDPDAAVPYLVHGRWRVFGMDVDDGGFGFRAQGFGAGRMVWKVPQPGEYAVTITPAGAAPRTLTATAGADGRLAIDLGDGGNEPVRVAVRGPQAAR